MTEKNIAKKHHATFERMCRFDENGNEFWQARQLAKVLDYSEYWHFLPVIDRAREACRNSGRSPEDHFEDILAMVEIGSGARREIPDVRLSRYACYIIVQNADPDKPFIANGQTYFAIQTRRQELADDEKFTLLNENEKRLAIRNKLAQHNKYLAAAAKGAGVETSLDYAIFQDHGYKRELLAEFNLHTIVRLPKGVFSPYTGINTNLLFLEKGGPTRDVWFFEHPYPEGYKSYSRSKPLTIAEFDREKKWWGGAKRKGRKSNEYAWKVSADEIAARNYNLDCKNPHQVKVDNGDPEKLMREYEEITRQLQAAQAALKQELMAALGGRQ